MYSLLLKRWKLFHYVNEGLQRYQHLPRFSLKFVSLKIAPRMSQLLKLEILRIFSISSKENFKNHFSQKNSYCFSPISNFSFQQSLQKQNRCIIFSLLVHRTSPSSPFPPVPAVNIMSRDTTPFTKCLYHFVPPTTWEMKIITKPHPKVLPPRDL